MANKTYTLNVRKIGERYEVSIPEIEATATGATFDEAVENAQWAIIAAESKVIRVGKPRSAQSGRTIAQQ
jgi:hypothetical protein